MIFNIKKNKINTEKKINILENLEKTIFGVNAYSYSSLDTILKTKSNFSVYSCEVDDKIIGYMITLDSIDFFEILKIGVLSEYRNKGIGQALLRELSDKEIFLEVRQSNDIALNFYLKNGFNKISIRKNYYKDTNEDAIIMKLEVGKKDE